MEAFGHASTVLRIASAGVQCSIKLVIFAGQVKSAEEEITNVAKDVSLNASILQQLGDLVKEGERDQLTASNRPNDGPHKGPSMVSDIHDARNEQSSRGIFNAVGLTTVLKLAEKCRAVFDTLTESIQRASAQSRSNHGAPGQVNNSRLAMLKWPFLKPETEALQDQLRDVRATLILMLQLAMLCYSRRIPECSHTNNFPYLAMADQELLASSISAAQQKQKEEIQPSSDGQKVTGASDSAARLNGLPQADDDRAVDQDRVEKKSNCLSRFCKRILHPKANEVTADQASDKHDSAHSSIKDMPFEPSLAIETLDLESPDVGQQSFVPLPHTQPCTDVPDATIQFAHKAKRSVQYISPLKEEPTQSGSQPGTEMLSSEDYLEVRIFSPVASIKDRKLHIDYVRCVINISQQAAQWQLAAWRSTSTDTVISRILALTTSEHEALGASSYSSDDRPKIGDEVLEWLHLGESLPLIDDVAHVRARTLTAVVNAGRGLRNKRGAALIEDDRDTQSNTWMKVPRQYLRPETLNEYKLPWMEDAQDPNYVIIRQFLPEPIQEVVFAHTCRIQQDIPGTIDSWQGAADLKGDSTVDLILTPTARARKKKNNPDKGSSTVWETDHTGDGPTSAADVDAGEIVEELLSRYTTA